MAKRIHPSETARSYFTEANAEKAVAGLNLSNEVRYIIVPDSMGRFVPMFTANPENLWRITHLPHAGFMIFN